MYSKVNSFLRTVFFAVFVSCLAAGCAGNKGGRADTAESPAAEASYVSEVFPLERAGIDLHLDCMKLEGTEPEKNILLVHGVTYSSHEFDINYEDYSLVRKLAREGYGVWRLDIAGFGESEEVSDGFLPDSDYAAEDIAAAVDLISSETGQEKIDVLGWSWGTVTAGRFAASHPEHLDQLVLYAPILCGIGEYEVEDPYLDYDLVNTALEDLPEGSELEMIEGGSHAVLVEKPYYRDFQDRLVRYLEKQPD
ncbi:MAG: alpha/beta hydrolase [Clostridium sp.]|nr:alpha/beta hydrolase [Clostridium sp.]